MRISVKVKTGAKIEKVEKLAGNNFRIWVKAPAKEGKANEAVLKVLAEYFDVASSSIKIVSGLTSRDKIFDIC